MYSFYVWQISPGVLHTHCTLNKSFELRKNTPCVAMFSRYKIICLGTFSSSPPRLCSAIKILPLKGCPPWMAHSFNPAVDSMIFLHRSTNTEQGPKSKDKVCLMKLFRANRRQFSKLRIKPMEDSWTHCPLVGGQWPCSPCSWTRASGWGWQGSMGQPFWPCWKWVAFPQFAAVRRIVKWYSTLVLTIWFVSACVHG